MRNSARMFAVGAALVALCGAPALANDEADELMPGKIIIVKPGKLAKFIAKPAGSFDLPNTANDPSSEGASLRIRDLGGSDDDTYNLPASGWKGLGTPPGAKGYKYKGAGTLGDPCKVVLVKANIVKAVCKGAGMTLTPPFTGAAAIRLDVGTDTKSYCAQFGGTDVKNTVDLLKRKTANAPGACSSPSGAFLDGSGCLF